jgi:hypothetical protein
MVQSSASIYERIRAIVELKPITLFFSYSRDDHPFAARLAQDLTVAGGWVWLDQRDISPGERWDAAVENALARCDTVIAILSPSSVSSPHVLDEISFGLEKDKRIVPVLYRECAIPLRLGRIQYLDFQTDYDQGLQRLMATLGMPASDAEQRKRGAGGSDGWRRPRRFLRIPSRRWMGLGICASILVAAAAGYRLVGILNVHQAERPVKSTSEQRPVEVAPTSGSAIPKVPAPVPQTSESRSTPSIAEKLTGTWRSEVFTDTNVSSPKPQQYYFLLKVVGGRLFGSVQYVEPPGKPGGLGWGIGNGKLNGNEFTFDYIGGWKQNDGNGHLTDVKESFAGVLRGDRIDFTYQREHSVPIEFTATKVSSRTTLSE